MALMTVVLVTVSSLSLALPWERTLFFCLAVVLMSYGLNALALSLGALLPNFREPNPARIISGFGGTLCLITSFVYILAASCILAAPEVWRWKTRVEGRVPTLDLTWGEDGLALFFVFIVTLFFGVLPYQIAKKRTKNLDYLSKV
jgi:ABC-2 type transport system permease protein